MSQNISLDAMEMWPDLFVDVPENIAVLVRNVYRSSVIDGLNPSREEVAHLLTICRGSLTATAAR